MSERQQAENQACKDTLAPLAFLGCLFNFEHSKFFFFFSFSQRNRREKNVRYLLMKLSKDNFLEPWSCNWGV